MASRDGVADLRDLKSRDDLPDLGNRGSVLQHAIPMKDCRNLSRADNNLGRNETQRACRDDLQKWHITATMLKESHRAFVIGVPGIVMDR